MIDGQHVTDLGAQSVTTLFLPSVQVPDDQRAELTTCVYWDFKVNQGSGGWRSDGCRRDRAENGRDVCVCDHLTNFAILVVSRPKVTRFGSKVDHIGSKCDKFVKFGSQSDPLWGQI